jgi:hypothetical protein
LGIGRRKDRAVPSKEYQRFLRQCGIETKDDHGHCVKGFHSLRALHATRRRVAGEDVTAIQQGLGHASSRTTAGYIQPTEEERRAELVARHRPMLLPGTAAEPATGEAPERERLRRLADELPLKTVRAALDFLSAERAEVSTTI